MVETTRTDVHSDYRVTTPGDHLNLLLGWLQRLLAWQIALTRQMYGALADDEYRGLYIPEAEIQRLTFDNRDIPPDLAAARAELQAERDWIAKEAYAAAATGIDLPLLRIARLFDLAPFARDLLLLALAPEIDLRYERIYAYIQDDVTKKRPSVDLALRLLCPDPAERLAAREAFAADAPLLRHRLIQLFEEGQRHAPLPAQFIKLDQRIVTALLGHAAPDATLVPFITVEQPTRAFDELILPDDIRSRLERLLQQPAMPLVLALQGSYGSGRRAVAEAFCAAADLPLVTVKLDLLVEQDSIASPVTLLSPLEAVQRVLREATLRGAALLWQGSDRLLVGEEQSGWRAALLEALDAYPGVSFLVLEAPWEARGMLPHTTFLRIELPLPSYAEREQLWRLRLNGDGPGEHTLTALASTFRLSGGQIRDAAAMARSLSRWHAGDNGRLSSIDTSNLYAACRAQSSGRLNSLAHKIATTYAWDDIVLPADQIRQLREICLQVRHRRTVLERWGFDRHLSMGKGVNVLFAGQSGTGKTMAAEIIAADLGLELYKVDLSTMVSKYIGETEKNLDRVFKAAREANAILFFDEADALFGKRSEVKDAHDRYANIEVGYLLQKMEEYDGVVILATNLRKNLDDAFVRRLHIAIDFPFPEDADRLRIWRKVFPADAPLHSDVDLEFLARQFKLAGGNIRNIALFAAYLAAEDGDTITMSHIIRAMKREYQKLGKLVTATEFGDYLKLVRDK